MLYFFLSVILVLLAFIVFILWQTLYEPYIIKKREAFYLEIKKQIQFEDNVLTK